MGGDTSEGRGQQAEQSRNGLHGSRNFSRAKASDFTMSASRRWRATSCRLLRPVRKRRSDDAAAARAALAWTHTARFLTTASALSNCRSELPEIAFVGRSNAGKSTAINVLTQQKRLAFASKTPGRTQHINLFELGPKLAPDTLFADFPATATRPSSATRSCAGKR